MLNIIYNLCYAPLPDLLSFEHTGCVYVYASVDEVENGVDLDTMTSLEAILSGSIVFCLACSSKEGQNWVQHDRKGGNSNLVFVYPTVL